MKKLLLSILFLSVLTLPAFADSVTVLGSYFIPRGNSDIFAQNESETTFRTSDLNALGASFGYDHFIGDFVDVGGSVSFFDSDTDVVDNLRFRNGDPIVRRISLQIVPLEFNVHILPIGREVPVIPYVGGGVGLYFWDYRERGDFVIDRFTDPHVITGRADSDGTDGGWHVEGGVQIPIGRSLAANAQVKYFKVNGDLDTRSFDPAFEPIDLSNTVVSGGVSFWF